MIIPADDKVSFPCNGGFKKFIVRGISFNEFDSFLRDDKFRKLINVARDFIYRFLLQLEFGTVKDFKLFAQNVTCDNDGELALILPFQNQNQRATQRAGNDDIGVQNSPFHLPFRTARISASISS